MTDNPTSQYPVRDPAPGPCVILDLPRLWAAVEAEMVRRGMTRKNGTPELKQLAELTGLDRNTLGRTRARAQANEIVEGQRGGLNVNAYLTLVSFAINGRAPAYGRELRGGVTPYTASIADAPFGEVVDQYDDPALGPITVRRLPDVHPTAVAADAAIDRRTGLTPERARALHPSRTGSPAASLAALHADTDGTNAAE